MLAKVSLRTVAGVWGVHKSLACKLCVRQWSETTGEQLHSLLEK